MIFRKGEMFSCRYKKYLNQYEDRLIYVSSFCGIVYQSTPYNASSYFKYEYNKNLLAYGYSE